jgi:hypothetical protein
MIFVLFSIQEIAIQWNQTSHSRLLALENTPFHSLIIETTPDWGYEFLYISTVKMI